MSDDQKIIPGVDTPSSRTYFAPAHGAVFSTPNFSAKVGKPTKTVDSEADHYGDKFIRWGTNNLLPQEIIKCIAENDLLMPVIKKRAEMIYGDGIAYGPVYIDDSGNRMIKRMIIPEIEDFLEESAALMYAEKAAIDLTVFNNLYPELVLDDRRPRRVKSIHCNDASECRMAKQNDKGLIPKVYINANWGHDGTAENSTKVDALDMYGNVISQIQSKPSVSKWVLPIYQQSLGEKFYAKEVWRGLRTSGWLDILKSVPKWKSAVLKNQIDVKYHIEIDNEYWEKIDENFFDLPREKQLEIQQKELEEFDKIMRGEENAGKYFLSGMSWDEVAKQHRPTWKITPIERGTTSDENNLEYADNADRRIVRAFGMHPAQFGLEGAKGASGSGSTNRVAHNQVVLSMKPDQDKILMPFTIAAKLNGWNERYGEDNQRLGFWFSSYYIARLDQGKEISDKPDGPTNNAEE